MKLWLPPCLYWKWCWALGFIHQQNISSFCQELGVWLYCYWCSRTPLSPLKLFKDDIMYLLTMDKLWKKRKAPTPLDWTQLENKGENEGKGNVFLLFISFMNIISLLILNCSSASPPEESPASGLKDQQVLGVWGCCQLFKHSVETLRSELREKGDNAELVWDKVPSWFEEMKKWCP